MRAVLILCPGLAQALEIRGDYVEARNADVFTGPCFSNAEILIVGKQAVMAWRVKQGTWKGVDVAGLCVAAAVQADNDLHRGQPEQGPRGADRRFPGGRTAAFGPDRHGQDAGRDPGGESARDGRRDADAA